jgi:hypothetical protein
MPNPTVYMETGEKRIGTTFSARVFFVYLTPTGAEESIYRCPHLKKKMIRNTGGFEGTSRTQVIEWEVSAPVTLKMVNLCTAFGQAGKKVDLYIDLDPAEASIEFNGLEEFGRFRGRGTIDYNKSSYRERGQASQLNDEIMKSLFGLRVVQPPLPTKGKKHRVRSLIFE